MDTRCTACNAYYDIANTRGNKIAYHKCLCGGKLQRMSGHSQLVKPDQVIPDNVHTLDSYHWSTGEFLGKACYIYYTKRMQQGEQFYLNNERTFFIPVTYGQ